MAYLSANASTGLSMSPVLRVVQNVIDGFSKGRAASFAFQRLNALSDAQLAQMGLTRQEISSHVVRNYLEG